MQVHLAHKKHEQADMLAEDDRGIKDPFERRRRMPAIPMNVTQPAEAALETVVR